MCVSRASYVCVCLEQVVENIYICIYDSMKVCVCLERVMENSVRFPPDLLGLQQLDRELCCDQMKWICLSHLNRFTCVCVFVICVCIYVCVRIVGGVEK